MRLKLIALLSFLAFSYGFAQEHKSIHIKEATDPIKLDGLLDEQSWQSAEKGSDYWMNFPTDTLLATTQTEIMFTYDDKFIYVGAKMYNVENAGYVTPSLRRDFRGAGNDALTISFDTFDDNTNAFQFGINPYGVRREGLVVNGGAQRGTLSLDWENKWLGEVTQTDEYWMVEMAIPFKSIRYKEGNLVWNINSYRIDSNTGERSVWNPVPQNFALYSQAHTGQLIWDKPPKKPGVNISVIPYVSTRMEAEGGYLDTDNNSDLPRTNNSSFDAGFDAKVAVGPSMNLDITVNPDFSQVEVDQQVTNLDRFEIFFPEKRQFFLENADLFGEFGSEGLRPFFSRRIGVSRDENTGVNVQNKINFGARLSGKLNNNWRLGILNMQAAAIEEIDLPQINYTVTALQRKVFARSNLGLIFVNKQDFANKSNTSFNQYNRVLGIDYNLASADNKWNGKFFYHRTFEKDESLNSYAASANLIYSTREWQIEGLLQSVGDEYNPEVGFARRNSYDRSSINLQKNFYPKSETLQRISPQLQYEGYANSTLGVTDYKLTAGAELSMLNTSSLNIQVNQNYIYLFGDFDPTRNGNLELPEGSDYNYTNVQVRYQGDTRNPFYVNLNANAGEYFNGNRIGLGGSINYRVQPYGLVTMDVNYNRIRLPEPYGEADLFLIGPRFDITFTKKLFWTTFIQYNNQIDNLNINSRIQWRFKPVSDVFIAYTDNYFPDDFTNKNRALVIKVTYWLNL
ncbi:MAG: carbohydrate binding family 9 domain-containing protein [Cytophagia bacterium]|nr:carbohydrate binding family 9 domain-containing protein [Cytophagia bacterium]